MKSLLAHLSIRQRISIAAVAVLLAGGIYALVVHQREADFKPLFTGVPPDEAAAIVQKLKESGVEYRLPEGGGTILVPSARLAEVRLTMAAAGLPKTGRMGFELFDKTNFGATEFAEHINYRRALEGELERSVMSLEAVEQARVHLTFPKDSVFLEAQQPAKASVLVKLRPGARITPQNVQAIDHLVASAVEGLSPDAVSVLDMNGNLLGRPKPAGGLDGPEPSEAGLDYRHKIESDLLAKINSTLEPLLGANRYRAGVSVECDFSGAEQSEEIFDPTHSVMVTSQRTEDSTTGATAAGVPGTASALPRPAARASGSRGASRVTENITYQTSRTVKKTRLPAGAVRRMSVAVLVDQDLSWQRTPQGFRRVLSPPSPEKLKAIRELVSGITGFTAERGDQIVIESLPFESTLAIEPPPLPAPPSAAKPNAGPLSLPAVFQDRKMLPIAGAAVGLLLLLAAGGVMLSRRRRVPGVQTTGPAELPAAADTSVVPSAASGGAAEEATPEADLQSRLEAREALQQKLDAQTLQSLKLAPVITKTAEVMAKHLREKISKDPDISAQVLRTWIREEDER
ncbi:MAG TPA: flagellar basal-body MS-ring/collar protein FliF [Bryobacteraceae bacterium]|jgi:flagellar M-ring protein FliF|nr:flagellar basal-body MS-ring/collar protein FliF [Bryobacteraceae bacterium]